jgi:hypothetical protein
MATASTEATCVFRKPAAADTAARYWGGANATAWRRGEFFQQRALSAVGTVRSADRVAQCPSSEAKVPEIDFESVLDRLW